jgi:protein-disulfide isomerase
VKGRSRAADRSPRVYYSSIGALFALMLALVVVAWPARVAAQIELTWSPSMVKGPSDAPVTIVEFSDYQ